jgi:hypothetical protein
MFEESRNGSWLHSIDTMLSTVMKRIVGMREELNKLTTQQKIGGERSLLQNVKDLLEKRWNGCAGFEVYELQESG